MLHPLYATLPNRKSRNKKHLAGGAGLENFLVGACGFGKRELFAHHRAQRAVFEAGNEAGVNFVFLSRRDAPKCEGANGSAASHEFAGIDGDFTAVADDDHSATAGEKFRVVGQVYVGEHFENDIHAAAARRFQYFFLIARFAVIENLICSFALDELGCPGSCRQCGLSDPGPRRR